MKAKTAPILATFQTLLTVVLTFAADRVHWPHGLTNRPFPDRLHSFITNLRSVWMGVNAPTLPLNIAATGSTYDSSFNVLEIA